MDQIIFLEHISFYRVLVGFFIVNLIIRIIWDITVTHKSERREHRRQLRMFFELGVHEGKMRENQIKVMTTDPAKMTFEDYLEMTNTNP